MAINGHLHFQSVDVEDKAGTVHAQGSSPSPTDQWHYQEGYTTSRRGMQMILMQPGSPSTSIIQGAVRPQTAGLTDVTTRRVCDPPAFLYCRSRCGLYHLPHLALRPS